MAREVTNETNVMGGERRRRCRHKLRPKFQRSPSCTDPRKILKAGLSNPLTSRRSPCRGDRAYSAPSVRPQRPFRPQQAHHASPPHIAEAARSFSISTTTVSV